MIGLWAAVALFGGRVFLGIDALYPSPAWGGAASPLETPAAASAEF